MLPERKHEKRLSVKVSSAFFLENLLGHLLLLQGLDGKWRPPAGGIQGYENPLETAFRELWEETGIEQKKVLQPIYLIGVYTLGISETESAIGFVFWGKIHNSVDIQLEDLFKTSKFFTRGEVEKLIQNNKLYRPDYNIRGLGDWLKEDKYSSACIRHL